MLQSLMCCSLSLLHEKNVLLLDNLEENLMIRKLQIMNQKLKTQSKP